MNVNTSFGKSERLSRPQLPEREWSDASHLAAIDEEHVAAEGGVGGVDGNESSDDGSEKNEEPVTWLSLPHRTQLIILTLARLSEPLVQTSLQVKLPRHRYLISFVLSLTSGDHSHICSINSNPSMKAFQTPRLQHKPG
jgi:hypothetical protein